MIEIATYTNPIRANIAKDRLAAENIDCKLNNANIAQLYPTGIFEIQLMVAEEDTEKAKEILTDLDLL